VIRIIDTTCQTENKTSDLLEGGQLKMSHMGEKRPKNILWDKVHKRKKRVCNANRSKKGWGSCGPSRGAFRARS